MFKSAATKIAHNSTIPALAGNKDLKPLQDLILAEKAVIISLQKLSADFSRASEALKAWGLGEGEDLGNILGASTTIFTHFTSALSQYASHGHTMREQLKAIRTREENLDELKRRRRSVISKAESAGRKLQKMSPEHKNLVQQTDLLSRLQEEIRGLDTEIMRDEAAIGDFKRSATRSWMGLKFGGLLEFCEKGVIAGEFGKLIISEIPEDETQPGLPRNTYLGHSKVEELVAETHRCVNEVRLSTVPSSAQPRRVDQQLPQVPNVSESPFMNQGSFSSPRGDPFADDMTRREVLPDAQGFGTGRFLDSPTEPVSNAFPQSQQQPQYSGSLSSASAFQSQQYGRGVDEFGTTNPAGPTDAPNAGGGRFATFPVKGRSGSMGATSAGGPMALGSVGGSQFQSHFDDKEPLSLLSAPPPRRNSDSFSSSVAQALAASELERGSQDEPLPKPGRFSKDGPAPSYEASIESDVNPWASQRLGSNLSPSAHTRQTSNLSDDEALLAYMSPGTAAATVATTAPQDRGGSSMNDRHVSRHVRFGDVSEIDDELPPPITPQDNPSLNRTSPIESTTQGRASFDNRGVFVSP
ncbi:hypothetical protein P691DRAFT_71215 [Macrolepiota fuliginosa MF-IS2]|uniref:Eisosome component PIL1-domain-containing protein n=1 Tax=Macrolepiota fuliginosa MF-IS2 TaxID=1400762 RepID=A0A9P6C1R8_9AGAR|nr:hypothetical protein P691DRAFT_71215 [Macrolepiota fuliginosa MF-IS2]